MLQICLGEFHIAHVQEFLNQARFAEICLASFHGENTPNARPLCQKEGLRALQGTELHDCPHLWRKTKKLIDPGVADSADSSAVGLAVDLELENPRAQSGEFGCQLRGVHQVDRALRRSMINVP